MRLIDADALKEDLKESKEELWKIYYGLSNHSDKQICVGQISTFAEVILRVKDAATIDAVPVVHGRWEDVQTIEHFGVQCTACGVVAIKVRRDLFGSFPKITWDYCPNCGARMDGE